MAEVYTFECGGVVFARHTWVTLDASEDIHVGFAPRSRHAFNYVTCVACDRAATPDMNVATIPDSEDPFRAQKRLTGSTG